MTTQKKEITVYIAGKEPNLIESLRLIDEGITHLEFINQLTQLGFNCVGAVLVIANSEQISELRGDPLRAQELLQNEDCFYLPQYIVPRQSLNDQLDTIFNS